MGEADGGTRGCWVSGRGKMKAAPTTGAAVYPVTDHSQQKTSAHNMKAPAIRANGLADVRNVKASNPTTATVIL